MAVEPTVSILIPVHNCQDWVARSIESALCQTSPATEIIVLNDGSTDRTAAVIDHFRRYVRIESCAHGGQNASRNRLTEWSRGEWLVYLDADDELAPDHLAAKRQHCDVADAIYGSMETASFSGGRRCRSALRPAVDFDDPWPAAFEWIYPNTSAFMFRRSAVRRAGYWEPSLTVCTDYDLYFRLLLAGARFKAAPEAVSLYRHWSATQAVHTSPLRRACTRLGLMKRVAKVLQTAAAMTASRQRAFEHSALQCIRSIYHFDPALARAELRSLVQNNPGATPSLQHFPVVYVMAFRVGGLTLAETMASWSRRMRKHLIAQRASGGNSTADTTADDAAIDFDALAVASSGPRSSARTGGEVSRLA